MSKRKGKMLSLGKLITYRGRPWRVGMVGLLGGDRYYWLVRSGGEVAMIPAFMLEPEGHRCDEHCGHPVPYDEGTGGEK